MTAMAQCGNDDPPAPDWTFPPLLELPDGVTAPVVCEPLIPPPPLWESESAADSEDLEAAAAEALEAEAADVSDAATESRKVVSVVACACE